MKDSAKTLLLVPLLARVPPKELERLDKRMSSRTFAEGETAVEEGRAGAGFWLIESGEADVSIAGNHVRKLGPGDYFGEIALIDEGPRSATVVAASELRCRGIAAWEFKGFIGEHPEAAWAVMQTLASRLREAQAKAY
jgi:CRP/FNR family transcriptional regulator